MLRFRAIQRVMNHAYLVLRIGVANHRYGLTRFNGQSLGGNGTRGASPQLPRIIVRSAPSTFWSALMSAAAR